MKYGTAAAGPRAPRTRFRRPPRPPFQTVCNILLNWDLWACSRAFPPLHPPPGIGPQRPTRAVQRRPRMHGTRLCRTSLLHIDSCRVFKCSAGVRVLRSRRDPAGWWRAAAEEPNGCDRRRYSIQEPNIHGHEVSAGGARCAPVPPVRRSGPAGHVSRTAGRARRHRRVDAHRMGHGAAGAWRHRHALSVVVERERTAGRVSVQAALQHVSLLDDVDHQRRRGRPRRRDILRAAALQDECRRGGPRTRGATAHLRRLSHDAGFQVRPPARADRLDHRLPQESRDAPPAGGGPAGRALVAECGRPRVVRRDRRSPVGDRYIDVRREARGRHRVCPGAGAERHHERVHRQ